MKKRILIVLGILIAAGAIGTGVWYHFYGNGQSGNNDSIVYVSKVSVLTGVESAATNRFAGVVEPQETVSVKIESGRKVKEVQVKTGDEVKAGQLLFEYDLSSIQDDLQQAKLDLDRLKNEQVSLTEQIATLEAEKKKAKSEDQLSYTIEIETNKMNLKKNEYNQKSKTAEIEKLQNATGNTEVRSEIDGVIQKIDTSKMTSDDGDTVDDSDSSDVMSGGSSNSDSSAFITILSTGAYRIKGTVNEMNVQNIIEGDPVIIRSRVDSSQTWKGTMGTIDRESATSSSNNSNSGMMDSSGDSQTSTSTYPFYVNLDSSDGLMLGQHVYIELDEGQDTQKVGVWISEAYIVDADTGSPYVWAANKNGKLEQRSVILGQYDEELGEYEIAHGLTKDDSIAFPSDVLEEGMATTTNIDEAMDTGSVDMQPVDELGADNLDSEDADAIEDSSDSEDDWNADDWSIDDEDENFEDEYESDDDSTVIDDPDAMGDQISDDTSDDESMMDENLISDQEDMEDSE